MEFDVLDIKNQGRRDFDLFNILPSYPGEYRVVMTITLLINTLFAFCRKR